MAEAAADMSVAGPRTWNYNEVTGWIDVIHDGPGPVLKGYLWQVERKSFRRGFTPYPFSYRGKVLEHWVLKPGEQVYDDVRALLEGLTHPGRGLAGRHIDLRAFDALGPYVDWDAILRP